MGRPTIQRTQQHRCPESILLPCRTRVSRRSCGALGAFKTTSKNSRKGAAQTTHLSGRYRPEIDAESNIGNRGVSDPLNGAWAAFIAPRRGRSRHDSSPISYLTRPRDGTERRPQILARIRRQLLVMSVRCAGVGRRCLPRCRRRFISGIDIQVGAEAVRGPVPPSVPVPRPPSRPVAS